VCVLIDALLQIRRRIICAAALVIEQAALATEQTARVVVAEKFSVTGIVTVERCVLRCAAEWTAAQ
jgi:hypothetical protein